MSGLDHDVWDDRIHNFPRILISHRRAGCTEDAITRAGRAPTSMWNLRLAESVGDCATDAVVVALDMSTRQTRRRKKVVSVRVNEDFSSRLV
jgi:hypothetical protein